MGHLVGIALPLALIIVAVGLARREIKLFRGTHALAGDLKDVLGSDFFEYTRWRLARRLTGVVLLVATAVTLAALELATTSAGAQLYVALITTEALGLIIVGLLDLRETGKRTRRQRD